MPAFSMIEPAAAQVHDHDCPTVVNDDSIRRGVQTKSSTRRSIIRYAMIVVVVVVLSFVAHILDSQYTANIASITQTHMAQCNNIRAELDETRQQLDEAQKTIESFVHIATRVRPSISSSLTLRDL